MHYLNRVEKSSPKSWLNNQVIFKNLPKVNHHPLGENLPNLVTLLITQLSFLGLLHIAQRLS
jgi:hypothetical protein